MPAIQGSAGKGAGNPRTGVVDSCEPLGGCWESNSGSLEVQLVLLSAELSPQSIPPPF